MGEIPPTRASLLLRLRDARNEAAWREFVDLYTPLVYAYARKQGLQDADAANLSQDVLRAVAGAIGRLDYDSGRGCFRNWLFKVVRTKLSNWRAARRNRIRGSGDSVIHQLLEQLPAPDNAEADWEAEWQRRLVSWACEQIRQDVTASTWQAFWRTAIAGEPSKQVADDLGLTLAAVYNARSRILARLKEQIRLAQKP